MKNYKEKVVKYISREILEGEFSEEIQKSRLREKYKIYSLGNSVYIWGAGELGKFVLEQCKKNEVKVIAFIDNAKELIGKKINGINIISPSDIEDGYTIFICSRAFVDIENWIRKRISNNYIYYEELGVLDEHWEKWHDQYNGILHKLDVYRNNYCRLFEKYEDSISRKVLDCILNYRISFDSEWLEKAYIISGEGKTVEYFDRNIYELSSNEVYVDCGGYVGDTVLVFLKCVLNQYKKIYLFEPSEKEYEQACVNLKHIENIVIERKGVGKEEGLLKFTGGGVSGHVVQEGSKTIRIITLDTAIKEIPTLIKMDVEGEEAQALKGAVGLIKQHKPKLAISIYHKAEDLFEIMELIDTWKLDYSYYIRHYNKGISGTVLYCIPKNSTSKNKR